MSEFPATASGDSDRGTVPVAELVAKFEAALQRDDRAEIVQNARQLIFARAPLAGHWLPLAMILAHNGEASLAREAFQSYLESSRGDPAAAFQEVDFLAQLGAWDEVLALLRAWPASVPKPASYAYVHGTAALYLGEKDEAQHYLEEAIRLQPQVGTPWLSLNLLVDFEDEPELAELVVASERAMAGAPAVIRGTYYYTLGKVHADRREPARAFDAYSRGANLLRGEFPYSREHDRLSATEAVNGYDAGRIAEIARLQTERTDRGIFVLGLPRSGTTLVEQILTSHSAVADGAEIYRLGLLAKHTGGTSFPLVRKYVEQAGAPHAARLWMHLLDERFPGPGRVVDKTLINTRFLGLATALLPEAPLIWLTRDPLDCAWSCFRTRFAGEAAWSYDLEDIAYHFRLEEELLTRWQELIGARLLVVPYERLVDEPDSWIRQILAHCGLSDEPAVFAPQDNKRPVTTSSAMQVRKPISRMGIGAAEPYRQFLGPFMDAYYG